MHFLLNKSKFDQNKSPNCTKLWPNVTQIVSPHLPPGRRFLPLVYALCLPLCFGHFIAILFCFVTLWRNIFWVVLGSLIGLRPVLSILPPGVVLGPLSVLVYIILFFEQDPKRLNFPLILQNFGHTLLCHFWHLLPIFTACMWLAQLLSLFTPKYTKMHLRNHIWKSGPARKSICPWNKVAYCQNLPRGNKNWHALKKCEARNLPNEKNSGKDGHKKQVRPKPAKWVTKLRDQNAFCATTFCVQTCIIAA